MRRKRDDKRVLRPGNGQQTSSRRKRKRNNNRQFFSKNQNQPRAPRRQKKKRKTNNKLVFLMILALVAFVIGAGIGVSLSFDDGTPDDTPKYENVTKEMTSNLNDTQDIYFDKDVDEIDYNENATSQFNIRYANNSED